MGAYMAAAEGMFTGILILAVIILLSLIHI